MRERSEGHNQFYHGLVDARELDILDFRGEDLTLNPGDPHQRESLIKKFPKPSLSPQQADGVLRSASRRKFLIPFCNAASCRVLTQNGIKSVRGNPEMYGRVAEALLKEYRKDQIENYIGWPKIL